MIKYDMWKLFEKVNLIFQLNTLVVNLRSIYSQGKFSVVQADGC